MFPRSSSRAKHVLVHFGQVSIKGLFSIPVCIPLTISKGAEHQLSGAATALLCLGKPLEEEVMEVHVHVWHVL